MFARNGVWFLAVPVAFVVIALGLSVESLPPGEHAKMPRHIGRSSALAPFLRFARLGQNHAEPAVNLKIAQTNAGPLVPITVSTLLPDARTFCVDVDLNHDGRFEGPGEIAYATGQFDKAGVGELRLHGLIHGCYRARVRVDGIDGEAVSAVQKFELSAPHNSHLPISFEVNKGQTDSSVLFLGRAKNQMVYVTRDETVIVARGESGGARGKNDESLAPRPSPLVSRFRLASANSWAQPTGQKMLPGKANYFIGNDPAKWRTDIDTFAEITTDAYPGIRMIHRSSQGRLAYDFRVAPGANPADIALDFSDAERLSLNDDGDLLVHHPAGDTIRHSAPLMYQEQRGIKQAVKGDWVLKDGKQAAFVVATYDRERELVIDPLVSSTYLGGTVADGGNAIAVDAANNCYITGFSSSPNFPTVVPIQGTLGASSDAIVVKLDPAGSAILYSTYLGGLNAGGGENGQGIAVDALGNAYVVGWTKTNDFPNTPGAFQITNGGGGGGSKDGYVTKLNPTGSALLYSTYLGGNSDDEIRAIAIDGAGNAYLAGRTQSTTATFPITPGVVQPVGGQVAGDAFVAKLNSAGTALSYCTYHCDPAGSGNSGIGIAVDAAGNAYVTGNAGGGAMPTTPGAFQTTFGGLDDVFVLKLNPTATARVYSTFLGGSSTETGMGIAVDAAGNAYVGGSSLSSNFPTTPGAFKASFSNTSGFVTKVNPSGSALVYSTSLGGGGLDRVLGIAIDVAGNAYVTGITDSADFPAVNPIQAALAGPDDAFVTVVNPTGTALLFSTFLGGSGSDRGQSIAIDAGGAIYITGLAASADFPTLLPVQAANGGGVNDAFIAKLTYIPAITPGVTITESGGSTNVAEGGATDTYTVLLNTAPTANVTITINPGTQVTVAPAVLTFTPANWNVAQTVTVTAVDDALVEGPHTGTITHSSASADAAYNAIAIASVTANITDNDVGPPPPPPPPIPGGGISEGSYSGSQGLGNGNGGEGTFGFGRSMQQPRLKGPYRDPLGTFRVFNVAHKQRVQVSETDSGLGLLGWGLMLLAVFVPAALVYGRRRPV